MQPIEATDEKLAMYSKQFITIILLFNILSISAQEEFKLISYNIWNGFDWGKMKQGRDAYVQRLNQIHLNNLLRMMYDTMYFEPIFNFFISDGTEWLSECLNGK